MSKNIIKMNDCFSFSRDSQCWELHETVSAKDKEGNDKPRTDTTYHSTLAQIAGVIIDRCAGDCETMEQLLRLMEDAECLVLNHLDYLKSVK